MSRPPLLSERTLIERGGIVPEKSAFGGRPKGPSPLSTQDASPQGASSTLPEEHWGPPEKGGPRPYGGAVCPASGPAYEGASENQI